MEKKLYLVNILVEGYEQQEEERDGYEDDDDQDGDDKEQEDDDCDDLDELQKVWRPISRQKKGKSLKLQKQSIGSLGVVKL
jgi:hypothetical protein